jgi:hypothetical protein
MMNDRFSAQLRQHLLDNADERPADGRLAAIVEGVAVTAQRHPLVTRLRWSTVRIHPVPSAAMRFGLIAIALIIAIVGAALASGFGTQRSTVFEGTWTSIDPGDGSTQTLVVGAGTSPAVHFEDAFATGAACIADEVKVFTMEGVGSVTDSLLEVAWPDGGGCGLIKIDVGPGFYTYNEETDALVDGQELTWTRVDASVVPPTSTPVNEPTPEPSPTADPDCIQFDVAGTYTAPAGSISLTVSVPQSAGPPWHGHRDGFDLMKAACTDMQGTGYTLGAEVTRVYTDACAGTSVPVDSAAAAIDVVSRAEGFEVVEEIQVTLGGYPSTRLDITVPDVPNSCVDQQIAITDGLNPFDRGLDVTLFVIDVEGKTLALALYGYPDWDPSVTADVDAMLSSLQIAPTPDGSPVAPTGSPVTEPTTDPSPVVSTVFPGCLEFLDGGPYRASAGLFSLTVAVPNLDDTKWQGHSDEFSLQRSPCLFGAPVSIDAMPVTGVDADACDRAGAAVESDTPAGAVAALAAMTGVEVVGPTDLTLDGYAGSRFEISVPAGDATRCTDGTFKLFDGMDADPGATLTVDVIDVDGVALGIVIYQGEGTTPAMVAEAEAIVASMEIEARGN